MYVDAPTRKLGLPPAVEMTTPPSRAQDGSFRGRLCLLRPLVSAETALGALGPRVPRAEESLRAAAAGVATSGEETAFHSIFISRRMGSVVVQACLYVTVYSFIYIHTTKSIHHCLTLFPSLGCSVFTSSTLWGVYTSSYRFTCTTHNFHWKKLISTQYWHQFQPILATINLHVSNINLSYSTFHLFHNIHPFHNILLIIIYPSVSFSSSLVVLSRQSRRKNSLAETS